MRFVSIKTEATVLLLLAVTIPPVLLGVVGTFYYRDVIRQNIWNGNLAQAETIATLTSNYLDSATLYLESQADRTSVENAVVQGNVTFLNDTLKYIQNTSVFYDVYVVNIDGIVISSYPHTGIIGENRIDQPHIRYPRNFATAYVEDGRISSVSKRPTVYIGVPVRYDNGTVIGVLAGALDLDYYSSFVFGPQVETRQFVTLVNRTGHIMVHANKGYMDSMKDFTSLPSVKKVISGEGGTVQEYNPIENREELASFSPVKKYGWGVLVAIPISMAYAPITRATMFFTVIMIGIILLSSILSYFIGGYFVNPILNLTKATKEMPGDSYRRHLPVDRGDELGQLARSFDRMADTIRSDQKRIIAEKDRAEEEKQRAELYVDIMGHDINNLNQTALASLELIMGDENLTDDQRDMIDSAIRSIEGSAGIIDNVRKIQKITGEELYLETIDINGLIEKCIAETSYPPGKKVNISYAPRKGLLVNGVSLLKEVFCNLINNSIKYSGPEVDIEIIVDSTLMNGKKFYKISISDNGYGIPDEVKKRLFMRFQRGTTRAHGKGLGLYIVRMLVERFGGSVQVEDRVPGDYTKGSRFIVLLPASGENNNA